MSRAWCGVRALPKSERNEAEEVIRFAREIFGWYLHLDEAERQIVQRNVRNKFGLEGTLEK